MTESTEGARVLTLEQAAEQLGLSSTTLRVQIRNGRLAATKIGPVWTVQQPEVDRYRAENLRVPGAPRRAAIAPTTLVRRRNAARWHVRSESSPEDRDLTACGIVIRNPGGLKTAMSADEIDCPDCLKAGAAGRLT